MMYGPVIFDSAMDFVGMGTCTDPEVMRMLREYESRKKEAVYDGDYGCLGYCAYGDDWEREGDE